MYLICHPLQTGRKAAIGDEPDGPFNEEKKTKPSKHNKHTDKNTPTKPNLHQPVNSLYVL